MTSHNEILSLRVDMWKKIVDTQMHFNEMSVKTRQLGLSFVVAALGIAIVLLSRRQDFMINFDVSEFTISFNVSGLIVLAAAFGIIAVRILDLNVYHRMLRGSVYFGEDFERNFLMPDVYDLEKGMTEVISHFSRHDDAGADIEQNKYKYTGTSYRSALAKIKRFYNGATMTLLIIAILLIYVTFNVAPAN